MKLRQTFLMAIALSSASSLSLLAQPKLGRSPVTDVQAAAAIDYWTPERRAAAIPRDLSVDQLPAAQEPATPAGPLVRVPGSLPAPASGEAQALETVPGEPASVEPLGFSYPFTRYTVLALLYNSTVKKFPSLLSGR